MTPSPAHLVCLGLFVTLGCDPAPDRPASPPTPAPAPAPVSPMATRAQTAAQIDAQRKRLDETVWADEVLAQAHEAPLVALWDALRAGNDPATTLGSFPMDGIRLPIFGEPKAFEGGIEIRTAKGKTDAFAPTIWRTRLQAWARAGYRLVQSEWHHQRFDPAKGSRAAASVFSVVLHIEQVQGTASHRIIIQGPLKITWRTGSKAGSPRAGHIDASSLEWLSRSGAVPFRLQEIFSDRAQPIMPVLVRDFDGDGDADVGLPSQNTLLDNTGGTFTSRRLFARPPPPGRGMLKVASAIHADFDGDGRGDLLTTAHGGPPRLFSGGGTGRFDLPGRLLTLGTGDQIHPSAITAGDIEGDGDLDLWLTQYKEPYVGGQMPSPYFDANDGHPSALLINDGQGGFTDATARSGLAAKRTRRTYASSLVDVDDDADLDLVVVSDFAGIDLHLNDGRGQFKDVTSTWFKARNTFGMSHVITDLTGDGWADLYVTGMSSTTARRLGHMGLGPKKRGQHEAMRSVMGYGNRAYVPTPGTAGYAVPSFNDQIARSGWTWGVAALDVENDGDMDLAAANGNRSGETAADYCTEFWRHDIYVDQSTEDPAFNDYFERTAQRISESGMSWNGFEHNHLFLNQNGRRFRNVAFLLGLAHEADARSLVAADFDGDGRRDLLVAVSPTPQARQFRLLLFQNRWPSPGNWIGFRILGDAKRAATGAQVSLGVDGKVRRIPLVTGDSFLAQHPDVAHFGLGPSKTVDWVEVRWADGHVRKLSAPAVGAYHSIRPTP